MLSVEPILDRTFFRSGAETLLVGRRGLERVLGFVGGLVVVFLASAAVVEVVMGLVAAGLGLGRLVAVVVLEVVVEVVVLLFTALPLALLGRLRSADGDFAEVFLASAGFPSVLIEVGLLGGEAVVVLVPAVAVTGDVAVVFRVVGVLRAGAREVADDGAFEREVLFSVDFASETFGLVSFGVRVEGREVLVAGRLGVAEGGAVVGLVGFLFGPGVAEAGRLGLVAARGLAFGAAGLADGVEAAGFVFFSGLGGSSLLGGAVISFPVTASAGLVSSGFTFSCLCWLTPLAFSCFGFSRSGAAALAGRAGTPLDLVGLM